MAKRVPDAAKDGSALTVQLRPSLRVDDDTPQFYVNHIEIGCTIHEFNLAAGRLPSRLTPEQMEEARGTGVLARPADVQLIIPPTMIVGLINAMQSQKETYENQYGITLTRKGAQP